MKKKMKLLGIAVIAAAIIFGLAGCDNSTNPVPPAPSGDAALSGITIKGVAVTDLGTPNATLGSETAGTVYLLADDSGTTGGTTANAKASVTKIVKYAKDMVPSAANFASASAYNNEAVVKGDFFVFEVTAENGAKLYYRIEVSIVLFKLAESNVAGETNFANVRFYVFDELRTSGIYNNTTYAQVTAALGTPVTAIGSNDTDSYLYAVEFTGAGSGTVVKFGVESDALTGTIADEEIKITLTDVGNPPPPASAAIADTPITVTATKANFGGNNGVAADVTITINLSNATVNGALSSSDAALWFSKKVEGLTYTANAADGNTSISITVSGVPTEDLEETAVITIPAGVIKDNEDAPNIAPLAVDGSIEYDIDAAANPAITDFAFTPEDDLKVGPAVAADAVVGSFGGVEGGSAGAYTYALVAGDGATDNGLFTIAGADLTVGTADLTVARTYSVRVKITDAADETMEKPFDFTVDVAALSDFTFTPSVTETGSGTEAGDTIGTFGGVVGGEAPYTYMLAGGTGDTDNALFTIASGTLKVGAAALDEARTYSIRVEVTDSSEGGQYFHKAFTFDLDYPPAAMPQTAVVSEYYDDTITAVVANSEGTGAVPADSTITINFQNIKVLASAEATLVKGFDVSGMFVPEVEGLTYLLDEALTVDSVNMVIKVAGTPEETSSDPVTITIPSQFVADSNGNPTITNGIVIGGKAVMYAITQAPENVVQIEETPYTSLQAAVDSVSGGESATITVLKSFELSSTVTIGNKGLGGNKIITLETETDGLVISRAEGFTGTLFDVGSKGVFYLGEMNDANPLVIDGKNHDGNLVSVGGGGTFYLRGAELRNSAAFAVSLYGGNVNGQPTQANFFMQGGVIAGNETGVYAGYLLNFLMSGGIIYGTDGGENANTVSVDARGSVEFTILSETKQAGIYTETFGTTP